MRITIESTDQITRIDDVLVRCWEGLTEDGTPCKVFVHRIAVRGDLDCNRFERELLATLPPDDIPLSAIL